MKRFRVSAVVVATLGAVLPLAGLAHPTDPARIAPAGSRFLPTPPLGPPREIGATGCSRFALAVGHTSP